MHTSHFSLLMLTFIPRCSQDENVNLVTWPVWTQNAHPLPALPTPWPLHSHLRCLSPGALPTRLSPDSRPSHELFPEPGVATALSGDFSAHVPLPQRSVLWPRRRGPIPDSVHPLGCGALCHRGHESCSFRSSCAYFFDLCFPGQRGRNCLGLF